MTAHDHQTMVPGCFRCELTRDEMETAPDDFADVRERVEAATWDETWRAVPGVDGYEVSDFGNVRSYFRKGNHTNKKSYKPRTLAKRARRGGAYPAVSLPKPGGGYRSRPIHRLVMEAFVGPCPHGKEVAHLNGDPTDNRLVNLAYVTHQENEDHKLVHGTRCIGEKNAMATLQGWQVAEIRFLASKSVPQGKIAALFDISHKHVSEIVCERNWRGTPARTDIPRLLEAVDEARREVEQWRALADRNLAFFASAAGERDAARAEVARLEGNLDERFADGDHKAAQYWKRARRAERDRDAARAEVERLREGLRSLVDGHLLVTISDLRALLAGGDTDG